LRIFPKLGFFADFLYTYFINLTGRYGDRRGDVPGRGRGGGEGSRKENKGSKGSKVIYLHAGEVTADRQVAGSAPGDGTMPGYYTTSQRRPQRRAAAIATGIALKAFKSSFFLRIFKGNKVLMFHRRSGK
jgi:hypothetical protein